MNKGIKKILSGALNFAEAYASRTDNNIDDVVVKAATSILRHVFGIDDEEV